MMNTHVAALELSVQQTNGWLKTISVRQFFTEREHAYDALRAVLHALRDGLSPEQVSHLGSQLPTLVRGIYYEGWCAGGNGAHPRSLDAFLQQVGKNLPRQMPQDALGVTRVIFELLAEEIDAGDIRDLVNSLPAQLRQLWPSHAEAHIALGEACSCDSSRRCDGMSPCGGGAGAPLPRGQHYHEST